MSRPATSSGVLARVLPAALSLSFLAALPPLAAAQSTSAPERETLRLVQIELQGPETIRSLVALDIDLLCGAPTRGEHGQHQEAIVDARQLAELEALGVEFSELIPDLVGHYQSRFASAEELAGSPPPALGAGLMPPFGQGSMAGFYTWSEVVGVLDQLTVQYPSITTTKQSLTSTAEGRDVWMVKVSDNPDVDENEPEVRVDSMHHAREPQSMQSTLWFLNFLLEGYGNDPLATYLVEEREIFFIPVVNPDGYVYNELTVPGGGGLWRKNRRDNGDGSVGVDLNRNYPFFWGLDDVGSSPFSDSITYRGPSAGSELETQAMLALMDARSFATAISAHSSSNVWLMPWGYDEDAPLANQAEYDEIGAAAAPPGWPVGPGETLLNYPANGTTNDTDQADYGTLSWTPEIGSSSDGFWPSSSRIIPLAEEVLPGLQATVLAAGAFVRVLDLERSELGDDDGFFEAGESVAFRVELRNSGLLGTDGSVQIALVSSSSAVTLGNGALALGSLGSFSSVDNDATPLTLDIDPSDAGGSIVDYTLTVTAEGYTQSFPGSFVTGTSRPILADDVEVDLGWTAGLPGDTASTGIWERGDPTPTSSSGTPAQPDDDHTPGSGVNAFVTGNGGPGAGDDDVDNGFTTLISPRFDLSGVGAAQLSYARWYALLSTADDSFEISISNDDGDNWTSLESVTTNENEWRVSEFLVSAVIPQTDAMRLRFVASDDPNNSLVEALIDDLQLSAFDSAPVINLYGERALGSDLRFNLSAAAGSPFVWLLSPFTADAQVGAIQGKLLLDPNALFTLFSGVVPAGELHSLDLPMPNDPAVAGIPLYLQGFVQQGGLKYLTPRAELVLE